MKRDSIVYSVCSFLLGLILGSLLIGPRLAKPSVGPASAGPDGLKPVPTQSGDPMNTVRHQLATLKETVDRDPHNFDALVQLGNMYMDAAKYPQAIEYYERALAVRNDGNVRTDLGICYKQNGQLDKALVAFEKASADSPDQWQPLFNEAVVLGEMHRVTEARAIVKKLKAMRPNDPEVQRLEAALNR
jgi:tetratricopeptide (TPR) repeat protein